MKRFLLLTILPMALMSCEKVIDVDLNSKEPVTVIEAVVTDEAAPFLVKITKTVNFSASNVFPPVRNASVVISDNEGNIVNLTETEPGVYKSDVRIGKPGNTYTLDVVAGGVTYKAICNMPLKVTLDTIETQKAEFAPPGRSADGHIVFPKFRDPEGAGNSYRFIQKTQKQKDKSILLANDNVDDGKEFERPLVGNEFDVLPGDSLTIDFLCLSKDVYQYFYSLNATNGNGPGGGTTPANPVSNISGGALGYFSAYTVDRKTIVVR